MGLFCLFAVVTQIQFNQLADDKIFEARLDTYATDLRAYDSAVQAHETCVNSINVRETYRGIFDGISDMFQRTADLPIELFPESAGAAAYQAALTAEIEENITNPVEQNLQPIQEKDCPPLPTQVPERPTN